MESIYRSIIMKKVKDLVKGFCLSALFFCLCILSGCGETADGKVPDENVVDEDVITAWDLCRINELCGDYYICGYMTYEEAMDISLENSLYLQEKYSSWDELMNSYILGYQFWQSDPCATDDSPTLERYRYYELLLEMQDGPYSLDWNMELKKEW